MSIPHLNRAILLTPAGAAAIAVVRLMGTDVGRFLERHFSRPAAQGRCVHGEIRDGERLIDDVVVVVSADGLVADINLHGGAWIVESMLELARHEGFEVVTPGPGPLPPEAVDGKTVLEREVVSHLPLARTPLALRALLSQREAWRLPARGGSGQAGGVREVALDQSLYWLLHPPRVAIVGIANVGKSTLANQLFAQERSITADLPGTTRDWVGEIANIDGLAVMLVDTPGQRATPDPIEQRAIEQSAAQIAAAELVVVVVDPTQEMGSQLELMARFEGGVTVVNKSDLGVTCGLPEAVALSARSGAGIDQLRRAILGRFGCEDFDPARRRCWTRRQFELARRAGSLEELASGMVGGQEGR